VAARLLHFPWRRCLSIEEGRVAGERLLATQIAERNERARELLLEEPTTILWILGRLAQLRESSPSTVRDEAEFLYWFILRPKRGIGVLDEREYFLGESALLAATACRLLSRREEAHRWLDRSEAGFRLTSTHVEDLCSLAYQRLALYLEERRFDEVLELAPELFETMIAQGMTEDAGKTRILKGLALRETGKLAEAVEVFSSVCEWAASFPNADNLLAAAHVNLGQIYAALGNPEKALDEARAAAEIFQRLDNPVGLAKLHCTLADALRAGSHPVAAIRSFRDAQERFQDLQMRADVASLHLVIADLLLDLGHERQAEWEVRAALPVIIEEKMVPEGIAALSLLEQSLKARRIDRQALRDLHGYFRHEKQPPR